jgi:beta-N-acetylhexosaminidase
VRARKNVAQREGRIYDASVVSSTLSRLCGQLLSVGFDGPEAPDELLRRIADSDVGGVMLFRPNIASPAQVAALVTRLREASPAGAPALLVSVDQEGGLVQRLRAPLTEWPDMLSVGGADDATLTERVGRAVGDELAALGIGWDFAPVLDVHTNPANPVIGNRAFGTTPEAVATQALAFWRGLRAAGLVGCGKHFPGHGDTRTDPALDAERPATLSRAILTDLLRGQLGFRGVVVSDDLGMKAVADRYPIEELAVASVRAGADHLLVREPASRQRAAHEALVRAAEADSDFRARVEESAARVAALKAVVRVGMPAPAAALAGLLGRPEHRTLAASFKRQSADGAAARSPVADS